MSLVLLVADVSKSKRKMTIKSSSLIPVFKGPTNQTWETNQHLIRNEEIWIEQESCVIVLNSISVKWIFAKKQQEDCIFKVFLITA